MQHDEKTTSAMEAACFSALTTLSSRKATFMQALSDTSDDSYATRNDLWGSIGQVGNAIAAIKAALASRSPAIDLGKSVVDYGYDPEEHASAESCGLDYTPAAIQAHEDHDSFIASIAPIIADLASAGMQVNTAFTTTAPEDYDHQDDDLTA